MISTSDILNANILIVDDQPANIVLLEKILSSSGYTSITSTKNPLEVFQLHSDNHYDLILLDLRMPIMDGFQVMERLKTIETSGYLPVIVITAQPEEKLHALKSGARDFISKPFSLAEVLVRVRNLLEVRLLNLQSEKLLQQVVAEQRVSDRLLRNVFPDVIVKRLKTQPEFKVDNLSKAIADTFPEVTVLFADIVGFTKFTETVTARVLIDVLNEIFTRFDNITDQRGLEKIKTIGDSYMAAAGLPTAMHDHAEQAAHAAFDMLEVIEQFNQENNYDFKLRIGLSSGSVVAGVIGARKFSYDIWGDVVNTASRMESHGQPGKIQITDATQQRLGKSFVSENAGPSDIAGKGAIHTWFLTSRHNSTHNSTY
jgi:adenylate cyclase